MTFFSTTCLITAILSLLFGFFIAINRKKASKESAVWLWAVFCFAVAFWSLGLGMMTASKTERVAIIWLKVHYVGAIFIPTLFFHFIVCFLQIEKNFKKSIWVCYGLTLIFLSLNFSNQLVGVVKKQPFNFYTSPGDFYNIYSVYFSACVLMGLVLLFKALRKLQGYQRNQIYYLFLGMGIGFIGGSTAFFPVYDIPIYPFGVPFGVIYIFIVGYSILIYKLMDFSLLMRWGLAFGTSLAFLTILFASLTASLEYFNKFYLHYSSGVISVFAACLVVLIFDPVQRWTRKHIDRIIFKSPDFQLMLSGIENELKKAGSLDTLTQGLCSHLKKIFNLGHAGFVMWNPSTALFELSPKDNFDNQIIKKINIPITQTDFLVKTIETERRLFRYGIVTEEELTSLGSRAAPGVRTTFWKIRRTMRWLGAAISVPIMMNDRLVGFIALGPKLDSSSYNEEDKKFLSHVAEMVVNVIKERIISITYNPTKSIA